MASMCDLCDKPLDRQTEAVAFLTCEVGHANRVHQKCFEKSIDKAIRVRSTRSASFENIARSATHSWKTQKCSQVCYEPEPEPGSEFEFELQTSP
mmetsp:Transcript_75911/g.216499  ORF Transcript_75911/g.216499 Transcript_75911/m.216499 type:complete len:95 (+) Transcript_75911:114-398(+)